MPKFRIVQVKPVGLEKAFIIEEFVVIPAHSKINEKYRYNSSYYNQIGKLNVGGLPIDYNVPVPATSSWKDIGDWYAHDTLEQAQEQVAKLMSKCALLLEYKTFKPKVIQEYD